MNGDERPTSWAAALTDLRTESSLRSRFRRRRMRYLRYFVDGVLRVARGDEISVCDIGGNYAHWLTFPFTDYGHKQFRITLVNIDQAALFEPAERENVVFEALEGDACDLHAIADRAFDIAHSSSVIEHVGGWSRIRRMAAEIRRVAPHYFVQTPNYWFPVEPHYVLPIVHFLPRPVQVRAIALLRRKSVDEATLWCDGNRMLTRREIRALFPDAEIIVERVALLAKSFIARSRLA